MALNSSIPFFSSVSPSLSYPPTSALSTLTSLALLPSSSPGVQAGGPACVVSNERSGPWGALILGLVFLLGLPGNLFIIWSIWARARRRSVTTLLILHLACADGLLMALTAFFVVYLARLTWDFGDVGCKVLFYLCCANMYASILLITLLSLTRLAVVVRPRGVRALTARTTVLRLLGVLWPLVLLLSLPALLFRQQRELQDASGEPHLLCEPNHSAQQLIFHYTLETMMGFVLPYGVIISSYACILRRVRQTRFSRRVRSEKLILAIICTFGLLWLPYHLNNTLQVVAQLLPKSPLSKRLDCIGKSSRAVTSALAFISSSANPVLYALAGKAYLQQDGLGFIARLFERMALDAGTRRARKASRGDAAALGLRDREAESTESPAHSVTLSPTPPMALGSALSAGTKPSDSKRKSER